MTDTESRARRIVCEHLGIEESKVTDSASFIDDLGADNLDTVELVMDFEEEFGLDLSDAAVAIGRGTFGEAVRLIERLKVAA